MPGIDSHQHFWKYNRIRDNWITEDMNVIQKDFMPDDLLPTLTANGIAGCVAVQCDQSEIENEFLLSLAARHDFIKGVIGWVDLQAKDVEVRLQCNKENDKMKGFRHILQSESQRDFMLRPEFMKGISLLGRYNFTYDILVYPDQLKYANEFVASFPEQHFVLDHMAKPDIKKHEMNTWKKDIQALAQYENVFCKISGLVTEAEWSTWTMSDFTIYIDVVVEAFGTERIMFGSDWPVCLVAASYEKTIGIVKNYFSTFTEHEQTSFFERNAVRFYKL
jgi:L-fuconolactonase